MGQNLRLPQRNIGIRFNPISRHYAHKMAALLAGTARPCGRRTANHSDKLPSFLTEMHPIPHWLGPPGSISNWQGSVSAYDAQTDHGPKVGFVMVGGTAAEPLHDAANLAKRSARW